jgi:hypothetical protein
MRGSAIAKLDARISWLILDEAYDKMPFFLGLASSTNERASFSDMHASTEYLTGCRRTAGIVHITPMHTICMGN